MKRIIIPVLASAMLAGCTLEAMEVVEKAEIKVVDGIEMGEVEVGETVSITTADVEEVTNGLGAGVGNTQQRVLGTNELVMVLVIEGHDAGTVPESLYVEHNNAIIEKVEGTPEYPKYKEIKIVWQDVGNQEIYNEDEMTADEYERTADGKYERTN